MPQIFTAAADTWLRAGVVLAVLIFLGGGVFAGGYLKSSYATRIGWVREQPVPFSHAHHVDGLGLDCRYCHAGAETSARAGLPATRVCMTCHSQLWTNAAMLAPVRESLAQNRPLAWQRVVRLPDYVYFDHEIHLDRGVPCVACHGRVDQMPLMKPAEDFTMEWCLDCHRDPAPALRPLDEVTRMDWSAWVRQAASHAAFGRQQIEAFGIEPSQLDDCSLCHR